MIIRRIDLKNFRSVNESIKPPSGGFIISGENGSGKSSWIYAINFALYGSVPDLNISDVLAWGEEYGSVCLWFEIHGGCYRLTRAFDARSTKVFLEVFDEHGEWVDYGGTNPIAKLQELFPVPQSVFNEVVIKQQGGFGSLTETTPAGRYEIFKNLSQIEIWEKYGKHVDTKLSSIGDEIERARLTKEAAIRTIEEQGLRAVSKEELQHGKQAARELEKRVHSLRNQAKEEETLVAMWKAYRDAQQLLASHEGFSSWFATWQQVKDLEKPEVPYDERKYEELQEEVKVDQTAKEKWQREVEETQDTLDSLLRQLQEERVGLEAVSTSLHTLRDQKQDVQRTLDALLEEKELLAQGKCPTCQRPFRSVESRTETLDEEIAQQQEVLLEKEEEIATTTTIVQEIKEGIEKIQEGIADCQDARPALQRKIHAAETSIQNASTLLTAMEKEKEATERYVRKERFLQEYPYDASPDSLYQALAVAQSVEKPDRSPSMEDFAAQEEAASAELYTAINALGVMEERDKSFHYQQKVIKQAEATVEELSPSHEVYSNLKFLYGKGGVPRKIIQRWVEIVEFETNRQLDKLTNSAFSVQFVNKTKTGKDTIDLEIIDNSKGDVRKFKTLSGGERTRINIALTIAMSNSFADLTGIPIETLWLDEVYGLDEGGQQEFARIIKEIGKEKTIVCATSCFESMSLYFDQVERMEKGRLLRVDMPSV